eukprot:jgi/Galph1/1917/GphlegSOOS_G593.1
METKKSENEAAMQSTVKSAASTKKSNKWYPTEDKPKRSSRKRIQKPTKLRASITPGTVLIILSGRFRGKRWFVVGDWSFRVNGVPLRRVNQRYVIATKSKIDIQSISLPPIDDTYFKKNKKRLKNAEEMTDTGKLKLPKTFIEAQTNVDSQLLPIVKQIPHMMSYLSSRFALSKGQYPHEMIF